jgi:hypothetical protein
LAPHVHQAAHDSVAICCAHSIWGIKKKKQINKKTKKKEKKKKRERNP